MRGAVLAMSLMAASCGPPPARVAPTRAPQQGTPVVRSPEAEPRPAKVTTDGREVARGPAAPLGREEEALRRRGVRAMDEGRFDEAASIFQRILARSPANLATQALHAAAVEALAKAQAGAAASLTNVSARVLARPPFSHTVRKRPRVPPGPAPKLKKVSEKRNKITDDADWFRDNGVALPTLDVPNRFRNTAGTLPPWIPTKYGNNLLVRATAHPDHTILIFGNDYGDGRFLAVIDRERTLVALLDFAAYIEPPEFIGGDRQFVDEAVVWAELVDGVLYVSNFHRTYANSSKGNNGYLTALDPTTGDLLWRSDPLVINSMNFLIRGGHIITGYGFTAEPDYMFVLDRATGKTVSRLRVKTGPDYIFEKNGRLLVRTYDTNYVFDLN